MSRKIPGEQGIDGAYQRAKEVIRFLKSLPEAGNMPISIALDSESHEHPNYNPK